MLKYVSAFVAAATGLMIAVPAGSQSPSAAPQASENKLAPRSVGGMDAKDGATITGIVRFKGAKPAAAPIAEIAGNAYCKQCYKGDLPRREEFVFGKNGADDTLQNVLVYVSKGL